VFYNSSVKIIGVKAVIFFDLILGKGNRSGKKKKAENNFLHRLQM